MRLDENYFFIHNTYAHFFDDTLNYFANYLYPRFHHQVVGTYDKAVEYIEKKVQYNNEHDMPNLPAIILNPSGEFQISDVNAGALQLWRFPNISNGIPDLKVRLYDPIYQDNNVTINPLFVRMKGEIELILLLNSFYEYCDLRMYMYQIFGGVNRPIYPSTFRTFLIVPEDILNFQYDNEVTNTHYTLDWESCGAYETLVRTTNRNEIVVPVNITPRYTLLNLSDSSMKYGGTDNLADWRLSANIEYEIEMPWYVYLKSDYLLENIDFNFTIDSYMGNTKSVISTTNQVSNFTSQFDWGLLDGAHSKINTKEEAEATKSCIENEWEKNGFFIYTFTSDDIDNLNINQPTDGFVIPLRIDDETALFIASKYGQLTIEYDYTLEDSGLTDTIIRIIKNPEQEDIVWNIDDILEIYTFDKVS